MNYLFVEVHNEPDDIPVKTYHEMDDSRLELRRVEIFRNGTVGWASEHNSTGNTHLTWEPIPTFEYIAANKNFSPKVIFAAEFNDLWLKYAEPSITDEV